MIAVNIKELVDKINDSPTMLVKVKIGGRDAHDTVIAKPAYYEDEKDAARVYYYYGPLDPERWSEIRYANRDEEKVVEGTILKQSVISAFSTYETEPDALPMFIAGGGIIEGLIIVKNRSRNMMGSLTIIVAGLIPPAVLYDVARTMIVYGSQYIPFPLSFIYLILIVMPVVVAEVCGITLARTR